MSLFSGASELITTSYQLQKHAWKEFRGRIIMLLIFAVLGSVLSYFGQALIGILVNKLIETTGNHTLSIQQIFPIFIALLVALILPRYLNVYRGYLETEDFRRFDLWNEQTVNERMASLDFAHHDSPKSVDLGRKVRENLFRISQYFTRPVQIIENLVLVVATLITLFTINYWYGVLLFFATIPELIVESKFGNEAYKIWGRTAETRRKRGIINSLFTAIDSLTEIKLLNVVGHFMKMAANLFWEYSRPQIQADRRKRKYSLLTTTIAQFGVIITAYYMLLDVLDHDLKIGTFAFVFGLILRFQGQLSSFFVLIARHTEDKNYIIDYFKFLSLENPIKILENPTKIASSTPIIRFENVSFKYPDTDKYVLKNINITIHPGEKLAIIGVNGAGKSTFIKLLFRFYDVTEGRITIDGVDLQDLNPTEWYQHLGSLFQKYVDYRFSLRDAVSIGDIYRDQDDEHVRWSLEKSEAYTFTNSWSNGLDQQLGKQFTGGMEPSVGQWQKLALARVFYRDANIYVLDEPTSAIDAEAEAHVFENLAQLPSDRTVLFVSHRFSTIRQANRICVIENGTIGELGTHEELIKNASTYKRLFELQAKGYQ